MSEKKKKIETKKYVDVCILSKAHIIIRQQFHKKKSGFLLNYFSFLKLGNTQFYAFLGKTLNHNFTQVTYIVDLSQISNVNMAS